MTVKNFFRREGNPENESPTSVERGRALIKNRLEGATESVFYFLKLDQPAQQYRLVISPILAAMGATYLFIRQKAPGPAIDPLVESMQNFVGNELPQIFSSLKSGELPRWDVAKNMATLDTAMTALTLLFYIDSIKQTARVIVSKMKKESPPDKYE